MAAHRTIVAAASPALRAAIQRQHQRQEGAAPIRIELGSHVQAADLRLLIRYAYSGVLRVPRVEDSGPAPRGLLAGERSARRLAALAHALEMKQPAALLQVWDLSDPRLDTVATSRDPPTGISSANAIEQRVSVT